MRVEPTLDEPSPRIDCLYLMIGPSKFEGKFCMKGCAECQRKRDML